MAVKANTFVTSGMTLTLQKWDSVANDWDSNEVQLCGIDTITPNAGEAEKVDVTDFCSAAETGMRKELSGLMGASTIELNVSAFDPLQDGQKLLDDAAVNDRFLLKVVGEWGDGKTITFRTEIMKTKERTPVITVGGKIESSFSMQMNSKFSFTVA